MITLLQSYPLKKLFACHQKLFPSTLFRHQMTQGELTVVGGRKRSQALEMPPPFLAKNPLLRAQHKCIMGCDPCTYIFSCAVCHESSFYRLSVDNDYT